MLAPPVGATDAEALVVTWGAGGDEVAGAGVVVLGTGVGGVAGGLDGGVAGGLDGGGLGVWQVHVGAGVGGGVGVWHVQVGVGVGGVGAGVGV